MDLSVNQQSPTAAMNFTENQQGSAILNKLRLQKDSGRFCDVVFHVKEQQYLAHRNVLAACSPYFDSMLKMNKVAKEHMTVACENYNAFEVLLDYVYTGTVVIDGSTVCELLGLANHFMIHKLKEHCSEYMERNLNVTNCFGIKEQAQKCGCTTLGQTAEYFIMTNISEIIKQKEIFNFTMSQLELLLSKKNFELGEDQKLWAVFRWLKCDIKNRESNFRPLLGYIMWSQVNLQLLYQFIETDDLFTQSQRCLYDLLNVLEENALLMPNYSQTLMELRSKSHEFDDTSALLQMAVSSALSEQVQSDKVKKTERTESNELANRTEDNPTTSQKLEDDKDSEEDIKEDAPEKDSSEGQHQVKAIIIRPNRGKHKRKGIPVKVRISRKKVKTVKVTIPKPPKRRGRPPKKFYSDQLKKVAEEPPPPPPPLPPPPPPPPPVPTPQIELSLPKMDEEYIEDDEEDDLHDSDFNINGDSDSDDSITQKGGARKKRGRKAKERIACEKCFYICKSESALEQHMKNAHKDDTIFNCCICDFTCQWNRQYYTHMRTHFCGPPYKCDFQECDYTCERIQPLLYHRMIHTDERPFQCTVCNMRFRTKNNLTTHLRCHTGEKPFQCTICDRSFATKGTLEQHSVTHSDHRPYLCDTCGFATKYQSHLIAHKRIHTGDVFRCQFPNCTYYTPKRSQLGAHMRIHMSIRSHICPQCGRGFVEKSHLVRHERIHLEEKPFHCEQCDYSSTRRDKLKEHVEKHHGENASAKVPYKPRRPRRQPFDPQMFPATSAAGITEQPNANKVAVPMPDDRTLSAHLVAAATLPGGSTVDVRNLGLMLPVMGTGGTGIIGGLDARMSEAMQGGQDTRVGHGVMVGDTGRMLAPMDGRQSVEMRSDQMGIGGTTVHSLPVDPVSQQHQQQMAAHLAVSQHNQGTHSQHQDLAGLSAFMNMF